MDRVVQLLVRRRVFVGVVQSSGRTFGEELNGGVIWNHRFRPVHKDGGNPLRTYQRTNAKPSGVSAKQQARGEVGGGADAFEPLNARHRVHEIVRDDEVVVAFSVASRKVGGEDGAIDHAQEA